MSEQAAVRPGSLILVPAVITFAVTLLRLVGELAGWSPALFGKEAGGGGSLVGITWLVPVFGALFGWKLARAGVSPGGVGRALGLALLAFVLMPAVGFGAIRVAGLNPQSFTAFGVFVVVSLVALAIGLRAWPALGRVLVQYALAARLPVLAVMLVAMLANWGTHYDVAPPGFPPMSPLAKWFVIGVVPQLTIWIWFTVAVGAIFGVLAAAVAGRRPAAA
jgi:hypothetical protein